MPHSAGHSLCTTNGPRLACSWRLLLLVLLVLLPVTVALAAPEPWHPVSESSAEYRVDAHDPSETPVCHHWSHQHTAPGLLADKRDLDIPASGEGSDKGFAAIAIPSQGPTTAFVPGVASTTPERFSIHTDNDPPIYLLTQRFRA